MASEDTFDHWVIAELMGHVRRAGRMTKAEFPAGFARLDIPTGDGFTTQIINPTAFYSIAPTTEEIARAAAKRFQPAPVSAWELGRREALPATVGASTDGLYEEDGEPF